MNRFFEGLGLVAACMLAMVIGAPLAHAGVNDYSISQYGIDYVLSKDSDNHSVLRTTERITAEFPAIDQNHGIERAIPEQYDGHSTSVTIDSVADESNVALDYTTYESNGNRVLRIGNANAYVHGTKTYVISYTQHDVTKAFSDTRSDEWYWDTNGTGWKVPIDQLNVSVRIDQSVARALTGSSACYQGLSGSTNQCQLQRQDDVFTVSAVGLQAGENVTLAIGFHPGTFAAAPVTVDVTQWYGVVLWAGFGIAGILAIIIGVRWRRCQYRTRELGTIIAEYLPPSDASVAMAANLFGSPKLFAATLIDMAVRHYIRVYELRAPSTWLSGQYAIEVVKDVTVLRPEEIEILSDMFGHVPQAGERLDLAALRTNMSSFRFADNWQKFQRLTRDVYGLRIKDDAQRRWFKRVALLLLIIGVAVPTLWIAAVIALICAYTLWPLTDKGLALSRYLLGLKLYITVAETDRLRMLQSPAGAEKVGPLNTDDSGQMVKLYERVLPYAVLFGQEKEWNRQLGRYYETLQTSPDWYVGQSAVFNAASLTSALSSFTTAVSSSTGGSTGGGSSGGGGGGGGGGGW